MNLLSWLVNYGNYSAGRFDFTPTTSLVLFLATWFLSIGGRPARCGAKTKGRTGEETRDPRGATSASGSALKNRVNLRIRLGGCEHNAAILPPEQYPLPLVQIHLPLKRVPKSFQPASFFIAHTTANLPCFCLFLRPFKRLSFQISIEPRELFRSFLRLN